MLLPALDFRALINSKAAKQLTGPLVTYLQ